MGIPVTKAELNHEGLLLARKVENLQKHITKLETKNGKLKGVVEAAEGIEWCMVNCANVGGAECRGCADYKNLKTKLNALKGLSDGS